MWILVNVTDSARPLNAAATGAAQAGPAVPAREDEAGRTGSAQGVDELARRRHRRAHSLRLTLVRRPRIGSWS